MSRLEVCGLDAGYGDFQALFGVSLAGTLNAVTTGVYPTLGTLTLIFAAESVIIGGLGSLWGALLGGMLLGVTQVLVSQVSVPYATLRLAVAVPGGAGGPPARPARQAQVHPQAAG